MNADPDASASSNRLLVADEALAAILQSLGTAPSFRDCIRESCFALHLWTRASAAAIFRLQPAEETLELVHGVGFSTTAMEAIRTLPVRDSLPGVAMRERRAIQVDDITAELRLSPRVRRELHRQGGQCLLMLPLMLHGRAIGILNLLWNEPVPMSTADAEALMQIGYGLAIAVEHDLREYESTRDGLTGLFNRREFDFRLRQLVENSRETGEPLSLGMMDVDDFKRCNDVFGHQAGDEVLQALAGVVTTALVRSGQAFRYGGEEFVFMCAGVDLAGAMTRGEAIRQGFAAIESSAPDGRRFSSSISIGVAQYDRRGVESVVNFVGRADAALYQAKAAGKNRVTRAPDPGGAC